MVRQKSLNTFSKGMDTDTSVNKYSNENFYRSQNMRIITKKGLDNGAMTNINGVVTKLIFGANDSILGHCLIRNTAIFFVHNPDGGKIYKWENDETDTEDSPTLIYFDPDLTFVLGSEIQAIGVYETPTIQKVYFSDGETFFKYLNIYSETYPITGLTPNNMDIVSDVSFNAISVDVTDGGELKAGKIQYAYQLYNARGAVTSISPSSNMTHLTSSNETASSTINYIGSEAGEITGKAVDIEIAIVEPFTRLILYAIEYTVYGQIPGIRIVGEYNVENLSVLSVTDTGNSIGSMTLEEFRFVQNEFYPKSFAAKNNYLVAAVNKEIYFSVDYDARAYRHNNAGTCKIWDSSSGEMTVTDYTTVPEIHDCINRFNDWTNDYTGDHAIATAYNYKYQSDGATLGGEGTNIKYEFHTTQVLLDDQGVNTIGFDATRYDGSTYTGFLPTQQISVSGFTNHADPNSLVGYKRDEVYRFGIVFIDSKGRESFVKWIGDIRFPSNEELPYTTYDPANPNLTYANILGIEFTIENMPTDAVNFRIVRAERRSIDKTILTQGVMGHMKDGGVPGHSDTTLSTAMYSPATIPYTSECRNNSITENEKTTTLGPELSKELDYRAGNGGSDPQPLRGDYIDLTSPEIAFQKPQYNNASAYVEIEGFLSDKTNTAVAGPEYSDENTMVISDKYRKINAPPDHKYRKAVDNYKTYTPQYRGNSSGDYSLDNSLHVLSAGTKFNNQCATGDVSEHNDLGWFGARGTFGLIKPNSEFSVDSSWDGTTDKERIFLANYKIDRADAIYGGNTYEARANTEYYNTEEAFRQTPLLGSTYIVRAYGGDTFINFMWYLRSMWDASWYYTGGTTPRVSDNIIDYVLMFPVESSINMELRLDDPQKYFNWGFPRGDFINNYMLQENLQDGVATFGSDYPLEVGNLHRYNTAYSQTDKSKQYIPKPFDFEEVKDIDTKVTISNKKTAGEYLDSWLQFKFNNTLELNSLKGAVNRLITFKDNVFAFQKEGVATLAINERSLISDGNTAALTLGTGGLLERYDYVTENSGVQTHDAVVASDSVLYYVDKTRKRIYRLTNLDEPISVMKGIDSLLNDRTFDIVTTGFDRGYNEALFRIDDTTIVFNEFVDAFISEYTTQPDKFLSIEDDLFSYKYYEDEVPWLVNDFENVLWEDQEENYMLIADAAPTYIMHKHNVGDKGYFYVNREHQILDSWIELIINPNSNIVNAFDTVDLRTDARDENGDDQTDNTFYKMEFSNNYKEEERTLTFTSGINESVGSIKRIARIWRTPLVPNLTAGSNYKRMVDTFMKLKLYYDNTSDYHFRLHDVVTYYRITKA